MKYEAVIGVEVHAEMETQSKMFCACPVVDSTRAEPNMAVCPVCAGMPGVLPVANRRAVEFALRLALALDCQIAHTSIFARKNYFYPDLPKGYQISQYEAPLARGGRLPVQTSKGVREIRIRRVHLEEDTGKLTHREAQDEHSSSYTLVDLNRAGVPLLEIVTEPDLHTPEEVRAYAVALRSLVRYLGINSGDMQKGVLRIEPNISVRPVGSPHLGTRVEVKNLNSFRALERSVAYEIERQSRLLDRGQAVRQETVGWDVEQEVTVTQRVKEGEEDYRYFPEPDLPPLVVDPAWLEQIRQELPELPFTRTLRFQEQYGLGQDEAGLLAAEKPVADYFEQVLEAPLPASSPIQPRNAANWISGELFALMNQSGAGIEELRISPASLAELVQLVESGQINKNSARSVLLEMFASGRAPAELMVERGLQQISTSEFAESLVEQVLQENPAQVEAYRRGKEGIARWLFGQVMRLAQGQANPRLVELALKRRLEEIKDSPAPENNRGD